jgi:peptidyl-prolyl cis-trans isomerase SurA
MPRVLMKYRLVAVTVLLSVAALAGPRADIIEQILVKVNGDIITKTELEQRQIAVLRQRNPNVRPNSDAELRAALQDITPDVIVDAINELLFVQRGKELGYALSDEQFRNIVDNIKKENKIETEEQLQAALKQEGMTMEDLRKQIEKNMLFTRVQQNEVMGKIAVNDDELKAYYEANKSTFTTPPQITLRELLVEVPASDKGVNVALDDAAKEKAEGIRQRVLAGEPFAQLAADLSDSGSKANGGLIGPISRSDLSPELQKEIQSLKPGELTPVLRTTRGYQFLKLESVVEADVKPFDEAREEIADKIAGGKRQAEMAKYVEKLREQAIIEWKNDEVKKAYEIGIAKPRT